ncbi:hypothetical protein [Acinetobacter sp. SFA]|uniref:hypothetical protein n=1 Tax=Acinetobacter sp. SFA TaxID=1805633 RepID=UPI0007D09167|nr:hypothetical protein [Acinetobacter sp. SFA]OAL82121.1 hypothetical protein AY607_12740 [Acinetobacter sp. SFA]
MKNLGIWIFILILAGCSKQKFKNLEADPEVLNEKQLRETREQVRTFILNADSSKFRNQVGDCGEVSYKNKDNKYIPYQRFIILEMNLVLIENQTEQKQFELSWKSACMASWNK